ncbi:MAG: hypothetical protein KF744_09185 [Taibaiella sp.]|nr:hypothetical protein [Taibaiella sp.]
MDDKKLQIGMIGAGSVGRALRLYEETTEVVVVSSEKEMTHEDVMKHPLFLTGLFSPEEVVVAEKMYNELYAPVAHVKTVPSRDLYYLMMIKARKEKTDKTEMVEYRKRGITLVEAKVNKGLALGSYRSKRGKK